MITHTGARGWTAEDLNSNTSSVDSAVRPWEGFLTSLCLDFPLYKLSVWWLRTGMNALKPLPDPKLHGMASLFLSQLSIPKSKIIKLKQKKKKNLINDQHLINVTLLPLFSFFRHCYTPWTTKSMAHCLTMIFPRVPCNEGSIFTDDDPKVP